MKRLFFFTSSACSGYRYGSDSYRNQGQEKDDEAKGRGNSYDFGARMYDSRLGRWLTIDPLAAKYPSLSPYNFVGNSPLIFVDPDGRDIVPYGDVSAIYTYVGQLRKASKLDINYDFSSGLLYYTGKIKNNKIAKMVAASINNKVVTTNMYLTNAKMFKFDDKEITLLTGCFLGSETFLEDEKIEANQILNPHLAAIVEDFAQLKRGVTAAHETVEAYIGASLAPGHKIKPRKMQDENQDEIYLKSHAKANKIAKGPEVYYDFNNYKSEITISRIVRGRNGEQEKQSRAYIANSKVESFDGLKQNTVVLRASLQVGLKASLKALRIAEKQNIK